MSVTAPAGLTSSSLFTRVCPGPSAPEGAQVMRQFPPRECPGWWPGTAVGREEARALLTAPPFRLGSRGGQQQRGRILGQVLDWLGGQPGGTWQERWAACGAGQAGAGWREIAARWLSAAGRAPAGGPRGSGLGAGLLLMICGDLVRPDPGWLLASSGLQLLTSEMARTRDPGAFAALRRACEAEQVSPLTRDLSLRRIAAIAAAKGGLVRDITAGDCLELAAAAKSIEGKTRSAGMHFYQLLRTAGVLPPETPASVRMFATRGQLTPAELIGQYGLECVPVRELLVSYLRERHLAADYSTLRTIAHILGRLFWRDLELHHPGISSLRLSPAQVAGWKDRITRKAPRGAAGGPESPRTAAANALFTVRAFYLDIAQWAVDDPSRWAQWAAPCPIRAEEIPHAKELSRRKLWNPPMPLLFQRRLRSEDRPITAQAIRELLNVAMEASGLTSPAGQPLRFAPHDFRRMLITDAIMHGMPPHIAQLIAGHRDISTTMGYKTVYPEEVISGHRAFIARRRALRPSTEYRTPTDAEWEEFLGHFERRKLALGDCGRAYGTSCIHEHSCIRCPMLRIDPAQRQRLRDIRAGLTARIAEAEREGWTGEAEGLKVSLAAAGAKLAEADAAAARRNTAAADLGMPAYRDIAGRLTASPAKP